MLSEPATEPEPERVRVVDLRRVRDRVEGTAFGLSYPALPLTRRVRVVDLPLSEGVER